MYTLCGMLTFWRCKNKAKQKTYIHLLIFQSMLNFAGRLSNGVVAIVRQREPEQPNDPRECIIDMATVRDDTLIALGYFVYSSLSLLLSLRRCGKIGLRLRSGSRKWLPLRSSGTRLLKLRPSRRTWLRLRNSGITC